MNGSIRWIKITEAEKLARNKTRAAGLIHREVAADDSRKHHCLYEKEEKVD